MYVCDLADVWRPPLLFRTSPRGFISGRVRTRNPLKTPLNEIERTHSRSKVYRLNPAFSISPPSLPIAYRPPPSTACRFFYPSPSICCRLFYPPPSICCRLFCPCPSGFPFETKVSPLPELLPLFIHLPTGLSTARFTLSHLTFRKPVSDLLYTLAFRHPLRLDAALVNKLQLCV